MRFAKEACVLKPLSARVAHSGIPKTSRPKTGELKMSFAAITRPLPELIANLDLGYLGRKLLDDDAFEAQRRNGELLWDEERVARALQEYKQFLALMHWHPEAILVPSDDIDDVWHTHILNTARYQSDCETIFGCLQHHYPTFGASDEVQEAHLTDREKTLQLFEEAFGEVPQSYSANADRKCGRATADRKCGRGAADRRCGRATAERKCGRVTADRKCGRGAADRRCGRVTAERKCGRVTADRRCGRL